MNSWYGVIFTMKAAVLASVTVMMVFMSFAPSVCVPDRVILPRPQTVCQHLSGYSLRIDIADDILTGLSARVSLWLHGA